MVDKKIPENTSQDEKISRGEFFGIATKKTKDVALSWVEKFLAPIAIMNEELTDSKEKESWTALISQQEVTNIPKMVIKNGKGYFVFKDDEKRIKVIYGMCPEDGFVMNYLKNEDGLYCASCQSVYCLEGSNHHQEGKKSAPVVKTKLESNQVYICLND